MNKETFNALYSKNKENRPKRKGFIGAAIGLVGSLAGSLIQGAAQRRAERRAQEAKQRAQNKQDTYDTANNLTNQYTNQEYVDEMNNRIEFAAGGKNKTNYGIRRIGNRYAMGGTTNVTPTTNTSGGFGAEASTAIGGIGNLINAGIGSIIGKVDTTPITSTTASLTNAKTNLQRNSYSNNSLSLSAQYDRLQRFALGGKRRRRF